MPKFSPETNVFPGRPEGQSEEAPDQIAEAGRNFFSDFFKKHPFVKKTAVVAAVLGGLMSPAGPSGAEAGLREKLIAFDQRHEGKEYFRYQQWEWLRDEIQKAYPRGGWVVIQYNGHPPGWYFEMPAEAYRPYANWPKDSVTGDKLLKFARQEKTQPYSLKVPPTDVSTGEFLMHTTGYLDYVKGENDLRSRSVYCPGGWLSINELQDQQARLAPGPGEFRLYPHGSKAHPREPWDTMPTLKPSGETYQQLWEHRLGRDVPAPLQPRSR